MDITSKFIKKIPHLHFLRKTFLSRSIFLLFCPCFFQFGGFKWWPLDAGVLTVLEMKQDNTTGTFLTGSQMLCISFLIYLSHLSIPVASFESSKISDQTLLQICHFVFIEESLKNDMILFTFCWEGGPLHILMRARANLEPNSSMWIHVTFALIYVWFFSISLIIIQ